MTSAVCERVFAICKPLSEVSTATVDPPIGLLGCGSNVSSWLGPPCIHRTIIDLGRPDGLVLFFELAKARDSARVVQSEPAAKAVREPFFSQSRRFCLGSIQRR